MASFGRPRVLGRIVLLLAIIVALVIGGIVWFDYIGLIDAKTVLAPAYGLFGLGGKRAPAPVSAEAPALLEEERYAKRLESIGERAEELDSRESGLQKRDAEIAQKAQELDDRSQALDDKEKSFNDKVKQYDNRKANIDQNAQYLVGMPPAKAVSILVAMDDQTVIDIFHAVEERAKAAGVTSLSRYGCPACPPIAPRFSNARWRPNRVPWTKGQGAATSAPEVLFDPAKESAQRQCRHRPRTRSMRPRTESASSNGVSSLFGAAGGKNKAGGLAGLFSEMLSQAQKSLGLKIEAETAVRSKSRSHAIAANLEKGIAGQALDAKALISKRSVAKTAFSLTGPDTRKSETIDHRKASERRASPGTPAQEQAASQVADVLDLRRRAKAKGDAAASESAAALGSSAVLGSAVAAKPLSGPGLRAKADRASGDDDVSSDRKVEKHSPEPKVSVLDLRRSPESRGAAFAKAAADELGKKPAIEAKAPAQDAGREVYHELSLDSRAPGEPGGVGTAAKAEGSRAHDFRTMLADRLREVWNGEIVQSARVVLRDGDAGTIRLRLKPESLGNVKIELNLADNNISGRIVVESDAAKSAFERNMSHLSDAFRQGGFDSARLEVAVGGGSGGNGSQVVPRRNGRSLLL